MELRAVTSAGDDDCGRGGRSSACE
jgi:hypothetical protein